MSREAWEFISSGAGDEHTLRWNEEAFGQRRLRQRALEDVSRLDTRIRLLGRERPHPIVLAPTSNHTLVHAEGEIATARGAGARRGHDGRQHLRRQAARGDRPAPPRSPSGTRRTS